MFSSLPESRHQSDDINFLSDYVGNLDPGYGSYFVLRHVISELANNVYDHSGRGIEDVQSYILSNIDCDKLSVCVIDDGISIPGLFEKSDVEFENDCHALGMAITTFSTVSDDLYERGNGLRTIVRLVGEGNDGEFLLVSRNGAVYINGDKYAYYLLKDKHKFNGTLVCLRLNHFPVQNIYELLEPHKLNYYGYKGVIDDYKNKR